MAPILAWLLPLVSLPSLAGEAECSAILPYLDALDRPSRCHTVPMLQAWAQARASGETACLARELAIRGLPDSAPPEDRGPVPPPSYPPPEGKATRDPYGVPNVLETENFVGRWGNDGHVGSSDVSQLLEYFEAAWSYEIDGMGMPAPRQTDSWKMNIYVGDTGDGTPGSYGAAGYFYYDPDGYPAIVMNPWVFQDELQAEGTASHEFFHALEDATGSYTDYMNGAGGWYWEACAVWVEGEINPENYYYASFLMGFAYMPFLPLHFFDYADSGAFEELHQYGAFIFPRYLSEVAADQALVVDSWTLGSARSDPLDVIDSLLEPYGTTTRAVWSDFIAHNAVWDYADQELYTWYMDAYASYYDDESIAEVFSGDGSEDWFEPISQLPQRFGSNTIVLKRPEDGPLRVEFEGDVEGDEGSPAWWTVRVVVSDGGQYTYLEVPLEGNVGSLDLQDMGSVDNLYLVVGAVSDDTVDEEEFPYRARMWVETDDDPWLDTADTGDEDEQDLKGACGESSACATGPAGIPARLPWGLLLLGLAAVRRGRR